LVKALNLRAYLIALPRPIKQGILIAGDTAMISSAFLLALLYLDADLSAVLRSGWGQWLLAVGIAIPLFAQAGFYRNMVRFGGNQVFVAAFIRIGIVALIMKMMQAWAPLPWFFVPTPTIIVFWAMVTPMLIGSRLLAKAWLESRARDSQAVIVYGAGNAGAQLVAMLRSGKQFRPVAIIDDNPVLQGRLLNNVPIRSARELPRLVRETGATRLLLAIPSASRQQRLAIIRQLEAVPIHVQTVPEILELVSGRARVDDVREIDTLDLLGRDPVSPNDTLLMRCVTGRSVMVTGAGGSIGSELCRQLVELRPARLVLFELSELALYGIERELQELIRERGLPVEVVALLGSVHHRNRVRSVLQAFGVQTVYHAAAYKHVPIVENNMIEGIHNNIIGTWYTAEAAEDAGVETFVLISTDKAVSPVNVMGATKRFAEMVLQGITARGCKTRFCMVRFGNVLESSGSVVPLFREQIRRGGPVTVTHPDVIRYFMTIPEAAELVIQAGSMARGGDVFVLDMGKPVRIADLARSMIQLAGRSVRDEEHPNGDITIEYTGMRPGEKLFEELLIGNDVSTTDHASILRAYEDSLPWAATLRYLQQLLAAAEVFDCKRAHELLLESVDGFKPVCKDLEDLVWQATQEPGVSSTPAESLKVAGAGAA